MTREFVALVPTPEGVAAAHFRDGSLDRCGILSPGGRLPRAVRVVADRGALAGLARGDGPPWIELRPLAELVWPDQVDLSLPALARRAGLLLPETALAHAEALGRVFLRLLREAGAFPPTARALAAELLPGPDWIEPPPVLTPRPRPARPQGVDEAFGCLTAAGLLSHREGQLGYARAAAEAFAEDGVRFLEAGPGTGKTFGYLIPLLLHLAAGEGRAVVATRTRALQEQLWRRDLPFLQEHLGIDLPCALLKGRENYLCLRALEALGRQLVPREVLVPLLAWVSRTETGDLDEIAGLRARPEGAGVVEALADLPHRCPGRSCASWDRCPSRRAREKAREARLVVVNHALLGADLASGGTLLGPYDVLVADEAHALPAALRDALSASLAPPVIPRLLGELRRGGGGLLEAWSHGAAVDGAVTAWERVAAAHRAFWAAAGAALPGEVGRYGKAEVASFLPTGALLAQALDGLADALAEVSCDLPDEDAAHARGLAAEVRRAEALVGHLLRPEGEARVFWYARGPHGLTLTSSPVDVGEFLRPGLWSTLRSAVLTSATLSVGDGGAALARELGLEPPAAFQAWPSPFPYDRVGAFVLRYLPHPDAPEFPAALAATLRQALAAAPCRALALFTSRRALLATAAHLGPLPVLVQGRDGEREALLSRFRHHPPPVLLLGLDSLWEGIDLPGEELELLVVARLPFPVPTDPMVEAQADRIRARGGSPFQELFLPRAVLRLRQGVGRLVRTPTDRGAVLLADPRLSERGYGREFLHALPVPPRWVDDPDALVVALAELFR